MLEQMAGQAGPGGWSHRLSGPGLSDALSGYDMPPCCPAGVPQFYLARGLGPQVSASGPATSCKVTIPP